MDKIIYGTIENLKKLNVDEVILNAMQDLNNHNYEVYENFMVMSILKPEVEFKNKQFIIAISKEFLYVASDLNNLSGWISKIDKKPSSIDMSFCMLIEDIIENDAKCLEDIERQILDLEDDIADNVNMDYINQISDIRKTLLTLKVYYENLYDTLDIFEDEDFLTDSKRHFNRITNRIDRLSKNVINLREYITQVREAYQSQTDISLNQTMKLFTVITAVFSPLTLLVGWYGMNFNMPELNWKFGYPMVIVVAIGVVVLSVIYFKRKKWF